MLEYGVKAGLIFCLAREFAHLNSILDKAIKYRSRGVSASTWPAPRSALELDAVRGAVRGHLRARRRKSRPQVHRAHRGDAEGTGAEGVMAVVERLKPHRIGHGIRAAYDETAMKVLREPGIVLELCPTSNLHTAPCDISRTSSSS